MDSQPFWDEAFIHHCQALGGDPRPELVAQMTGASIRQARELIAATGATRSWDDPATQEAFEAIAHDVEASVSAAPPLLPGALRITSALSEVGLAQGIVSASPRRIVEKVASALGDVFAVLVTGDDGVGAKPDPLPYATAVERLDLRPQDCVVVEDSPTGAPRPGATGSTWCRSGRPSTSRPTPASSSSRTWPRSPRTCCCGRTAESGRNQACPTHHQHPRTGPAREHEVPEPDGMDRDSDEDSWRRRAQGDAVPLTVRRPWGAEGSPESPGPPTGCAGSRRRGGSPPPGRWTGTPQRPSRASSSTATAAGGHR